MASPKAPRSSRRAGAWLLAGVTGAAIASNVAFSVTTLAQWSDWCGGFCFTPTTASANNTAQMLSTQGGAGAPMGANAGPPQNAFVYATGWDSGANTKYWQITVNTAGFAGLTLSSKHCSLPALSGSQGPRDFKVQYSLNGTAWTDVAGGSFQATTSWTQAVNNLALPAACENQATVYLRWIMTSNAGAFNGGAVTSNAQAQIDDIVVASSGGNVAPAVMQQPTDQTVCAGNMVSFTSAATGSPTPTVQWQVNNGSGFTNIGGATALTYTHTALAAENGYQYRAVFTNAAGGATSNAATLTVNTAPSINAQPQTSSCGNPATFHVGASGAGLTYQWQVDDGSGFANISNGGPYGGATTDTLTITSPPPGLNGYSYRCIVSGTCTPNATSNGAVLNVDVNGPTVTAPNPDTVTQTLCQ